MKLSKKAKAIAVYRDETAAPRNFLATA